MVPTMNLGKKAFPLLIAVISLALAIFVLNDRTVAGSLIARIHGSSMDESRGFPADYGLTDIFMPRVVPFLFVCDFYDKLFDVDPAFLKTALGQPGKIRVYAPERWKKEICALLGEYLTNSSPSLLSNIVFTGNDAIAEHLRNEKTAVAFVPWYLTGPHWRSLMFSGTGLWTGVPGSYPLQIKTFRLVPTFNYKKKTVIAIGGTVVLARGTRNFIESHQDITLPWSGIGGILKKADLAIVNFKSPLVYDFKNPTDKLQLYGKAEYAAGLAYAGIDAVSVSGNHSGDAGLTGITNTLEILKKMNIRASGLGTNMDEASTPIRMKLANLTIGFLGTDHVPSSANRAQNKPPVTGISWMDDRLPEYIRKARPSVDFLIVLPNWGFEYMTKPIPDQVKWARKMIDSGADLVTGDQAHWVQNSDFYKDKFISYGLGNLIFDQTWSSNTREGVIERYAFYGKTLMAIDIVPVYLEDDHIERETRDRSIRDSILSKVLNYR